MLDINAELGNIENKNYNNIFARCALAGLLDTLNGKVKWTNTFSDEIIDVVVPFRSSLTGDENFNKDAYIDDIPDSIRREGPIDELPRAAITFTSIKINSDEFTNPGIRIWAKKENPDGTIQKIHGKLKSIPVTITYSMEALVDSEGDAHKFWQEWSANMWPYRIFTFEYKFLRMDAVVQLSDDNTIELPREFGYTTKMTKSIKSNLEVKTYLPVLSDIKLANDGLIKTFIFKVHDALGQITANNNGGRRAWPYNKTITKRNTWGMG